MRTLLTSWFEVVKSQRLHRDSVESILLAVLCGYAFVLFIEAYAPHVRDWDSGRITGLLLFFIWMSSLALYVGTRKKQTSNKRTDYIVATFLIAVILGGLWIHGATVLRHWEYPQLNDIAGRTISAIEAVQRGENPYTLSAPWRDVLALGTSYFHGSGYVYMPLMIAIYYPLAASMGPQGIVLTNLLLFLASAALIFVLAHQLSSTFAALWAVAMYVHTPLIPPEIYNVGVTDLAAVVPLLVAFVLWPSRPLLSAIAVGASISVKVFPGALLILLLTTKSNWRSVTAGLSIGLVPVWIFVLLSPIDLLAGTTLFNLTRAADPTSLQYWLGQNYKWFGVASMSAVIATACITLWRQQLHKLPRVAVYVVLVTGILLVGPANHANYQLWWLPLYCILLAVVLSDFTLHSRSVLRSP